ncbi:MAG: succinate dehydrogenase/fumarate reductase iron-sulfur subunit [Halobacteriaceae archaeon]
MSTDHTDTAEAESTTESSSETETEPAATETEDAPGPAGPQAQRLQRKEAAAQERADREATAAEEAEETVHLKVFRYDPDVEGKREPRFDDFHVPYHQGMTVLDALIYARDEYDSSLTFRHSCRQAICGSDAMFVNGSQRLCCKTQLGELAEPVRIEPLPHQEVIKDLVVDMQHFYDQMETVEPYFQTEEYPDGELEEQRQSRENREKIKMSTRCIWCGACMSSCNISCTEVCPKDIPLTEHIQALKREAVKDNLKFW